jgi:hypothetical protein
MADRTKTSQCQKSDVRKLLRGTSDVRGEELSFFLFMALVLWGCSVSGDSAPRVSGGAPASVLSSPEARIARPGVTSLTEVRQQLGSERSARSLPLERGQVARVLEYPHCRIQLNRDRVRALFCRPQNGETSVQTWRHRWQGKHLQERRLAGSAERHAEEQFELRNPEGGQSVIFEKKTGKVIWVVLSQGSHS